MKFEASKAILTLVFWRVLCIFAHSEHIRGSHWGLLISDFWPFILPISDFLAKFLLMSDFWANIFYWLAIFWPNDYWLAIFGPRLAISEVPHWNPHIRGLCTRNTRRNVRSVFRDTSFLGVNEVPKCSGVQVSQLIYRSPVWASTKCINGKRGA